MTQSAAFVLILLILGDAVVERFGLPFPGAALGLAALAMAFALRGGPDTGSERLFDFAAPYFPLFFVPAAVGVIASLDVLALAWFHCAAAVVGGTALTILVTGRVAQALLTSRAGRFRA
jgi:holin-like protein